ncbi:chemotaxis protein CheB [Marivirga sp. S37H4]|uniref:protein-glutamate methylesterase n=1 Tax=Marivirga aurantiaca TaxID=2802615 RepID=A0A934WVV2_9BACT|nr:chemotaxis protein CheB [Marivirga aurantiaca]MBK6263912.1 chemotaxis protein CheB [Marivirga aurantiaca]
MAKKASFRLFVIGASSGGHSAVKAALANIPADINAAFLVVIHSGYNTISNFVKHLSGRTSLKVVQASHNLEIEAGTVYISIPDKHLVVQDGVMLLSYGPRENLFRPSIDALFRSAAVTYKNQCMGILLSGRLNDGTAGLEAIKDCGGLTMIQNPETAEFEEMPLFAQQHMVIDFIVNVEDISAVIDEISMDDLPPEKEAPVHLIRENAIATNLKSDVIATESLGDRVPLSCPECKGVLWEMKNSNIVRYRCHIGHSYTEEALVESKDNGLEEALWIALRTLEEKRMLLLKIISDYKKRNLSQLVLSYENKLEEVLRHINQIRKVMQLEKQ